MSQEPSPDKNGAETPSPQPFAGRLRGQAAFLASNYNDLSSSEAQVIVKALESAADHVEAYLASTVSHVVPSKPIGARDGVLCYSPGDQCAGCDHYEGKAPVCSFAPSTTPLSEATPRTDAVMDSITVAAHSEWSALEELARQLERELGESMNRCDEALEAAEAAVRQRDSATSATACSAARYEWLRAHMRWANDTLSELWFDACIGLDPEIAAELDKAIDRAMRAADGGKA